MEINSTLKNLAARGFSVKHFASSREATAYLVSVLEGKTVGIGGSKTVEALGIYEKLDTSNVFWHWKECSPEIMKNAANAEVYLSSANAISEGGEIVNIDGTGNRISSLAYGHKKTYIIAGVNKLCPDFNSALERARNVAAVKNCTRFEAKKTPCKLDGKCHDCRSADRICNGLLVLWGPMDGTETEVILIDEELGM